MHISHGIIIKRNFARCLRAFYGSGLSLKGMLLRVTCFIAHQPGTRTQGGRFISCAPLLELCVKAGIRD